jgi:hypothetical protein
MSPTNSSLSSSAAASHGDPTPPPAGHDLNELVVTAGQQGTTDFHDNFVDNYDLDAEGGGDYTLSQRLVHYCGGHITTDHWIACKAVLAFHAGASLSKLSIMTKAVKEATMMELYESSIAA